MSRRTREYFVGCQNYLLNINYWDSIQPSLWDRRSDTSQNRSGDASSTILQRKWEWWRETPLDLLGRWNMIGIWRITWKNAHCHISVLQSPSLHSSILHGRGGHGLENEWICTPRQDQQNVPKMGGLLHSCRYRTLAWLCTQRQARKKAKEHIYCRTFKTKLCLEGKAWINLNCSFLT